MNSKKENSNDTEHYNVIDREPVYKENADINDLAYDELVQHSRHFLELSSDAFHETNNNLASYYLLVSERFSNELRLRVVNSSI